MDTIIYRQHDAAGALTGKAFVLAMAGISLRIALAQVVISLLIRMTGVALLSLALYLYAAWLLLDGLRRTVAGCVYTLRGDRIVLERRLGDSTVAVISVPLAHVVSMRPIRKGERLKTTYRHVKAVDPACRPPMRVRAAFVVSLLSSRLARLCAGRDAQKEIGHVLVFDEENRRCAVVFAPDERMWTMLAGMLGDAYGFDERMTRAKVTTLWGRALERAFPALYPYVEPLVDGDEVARARAEVAARREARRAEKEKRTQNTKGAVKETAQQDRAEASEGEMPEKRRRRKQE